jgi:hypothetical protein
MGYRFMAKILLQTFERLNKIRRMLKAVFYSVFRAVDRAGKVSCKT